MPNLVDLKADPLATFGDGKYMLIEFHIHHIPEIQKQVLFDLKMSGVTPIIAHPERYKQVQENITLAYDWLNAGCLLQVDAGSVLGYLGSGAQVTSEAIPDRPALGEAVLLGESESDHYHLPIPFWSERSKLGFHPGCWF